MKFREYLREAAGKNIKVGSQITWKNDEGDTLTGTVEKMTKDFSGVKVFKIKAKMGGKGKAVLATWPVAEIMRKATVLKEGEELEEKECNCDELEEGEVCEACSEEEELEEAIADLYDYFLEYDEEEEILDEGVLDNIKKIKKGIDKKIKQGKEDFEDLLTRLMPFKMPAKQAIEVYTDSFNKLHKQHGKKAIPSLKKFIKRLENRKEKEVADALKKHLETLK